MKKFSLHFFVMFLFLFGLIACEKPSPTPEVTAQATSAPEVTPSPVATATPLPTPLPLPTPTVPPGVQIMNVSSGKGHSQGEWGGTIFPGTHTLPEKWVFEETEIGVGKLTFLPTNQTFISKRTEEGLTLTGPDGQVWVGAKGDRVWEVTLVYQNIQYQFSLASLDLREDVLRWNIHFRQADVE